MDAAHIFRQGLNTVPPRQNHGYVQPRKQPSNDDDLSDGGDSSQRVAHTLTACCRCRQRKTRCDPTLPRCLPCERSGSVCEYLDTAKGRKINRNYVIKLQDKVRALEAELAQFTDDDHDYSGTGEDMVRPGGMIRLNGNDETPRYLGPSSGIAMSRLLMEEAKRFTESARISDLVPDVKVRKERRMQSIQMTGSISGRKKSIYPMSSQLPAENLPSRDVADKLYEVYIQKAQVHWPILHDKVLLADFDAVYQGDTDSCRNFVVRVVLAIALQKLESQYAGLADSYYIAAMQYIEDVIRPKDLKTLQCLALVGHYSLLTPTRTPVYYVIGLATRICHQEGLTDEATITGYNLNPREIDMRRRLVWIVAAMEMGLAHSMGRPSGFAKGDCSLDVGFFAAVDDDHITEHGIQNGPTSTSKLVAIHFFKMRLCQAEIRRMLYEKKRPEPKTEAHPWYEHMETRIKDWLDKSPEGAKGSKEWFLGRYHQMKVFLYRPSPQVPKPSPRAAKICFESSAHIIDNSYMSVEHGDEDITWVFILALNMSLNTILWSTSYPDVRQAHPKEEVQDLVRKSLAILNHSAERWPGCASASQLYEILSKACLQSYESREASEAPSHSAFSTPLSIVESHASPESFQANPSQQQMQYLNAPQFGYVFDSPPESMNNFAFDPNYPPPQPSFRSNSIFRNPATSDMHGRRFSYFPPDFTQPGETIEEASPPMTTPDHSLSSPPDQLPTPPETNPASAMGVVPPGVSVSPEAVAQTNAYRPVPGPRSSPQRPMPTQGQPQHRMVAFSAVGQNAQPPVAQKPLPQPANASDWFSPAPPFVSPYNFSQVNNNFFNDAMAGSANFAGVSGPGGMVMQGIPEMAHLGYAQERQGSLTPSQQLELLNVLETEGLGDIDAFLSNGNNLSMGRLY